MKNNIRTILTSDLDAVDCIQRRSFAADLVEPVSVFEQIITAYPKGTFVYEVDGQVVAYLMTNPIPDDMVDGLEGGCPEDLTGDETVLYLHDLCLDPDAQGQGIAKELCSHLSSFANVQQFKKIRGVAVQGSFPFWQKMGFVYVSSYDYGGTEGILMEKAL